MYPEIRMSSGDTSQRRKVPGALTTSQLSLSIGICVNAQDSNEVVYGQLTHGSSYRSSISAVISHNRLYPRTYAQQGKCHLYPVRNHEDTAR